MLLSELLEKIPGVELRGDPLVRFEGVAYDSRQVRAGDLFIAISGEKADGNQYLHQAVERGAAALASEKSIYSEPAVACLKVHNAREFLAQASLIIYQDPPSRLNLAAITGTNGKTTTSYLIGSIYREAGLRSCLVGTIGMKIGDRSYPSKHTTPEAPDILQLLHRAVLEGCTHGVMEVSSHALVLQRVLGMRFRVGVFTNLTRDHLDYHQNMESYYEAKRLLFTSGAAAGLGTAVINTDDPYGSRLAAEIGETCRVLSFGLNIGADIHPTDFRNHIHGTDIHIATPAGKISIHSRLIGRPNLYNVMAATGAALMLGIGLEAIRLGVEALAGVPGRMERVEAGQPFTVIVDYAHTPDALQNLLDTLRQLPHRRLITVFGCGGDRDRTKRPLMGEVASKMSDFAIATSDNPRSEDPLKILEEIEPGLKQGPAAYALIPDRREAIGQAISMCEKGDIVAVAGKGHEDYQIIGARVNPFDDRVVARECILGHSDTQRSSALK
jgi:UDP-N-acetylmuramoyl-L-alanyl-D-glutamate--2,6-diaminopimelate ligase